MKVLTNNEADPLRGKRFVSYDLNINLSLMLGDPKCVPIFQIYATLPIMDLDKLNLEWWFGFRLKPILSNDQTGSKLCWERRGFRMRVFRKRGFRNFITVLLG